MEAFEEVSRALGQVMRTYIDEKVRDGADRDEISCQVAKAMIMQGGMILGHLLEITDPDEGMRPARDCLLQYQLIADSAEDGEIDL